MAAAGAGGRGREWEVAVSDIAARVLIAGHVQGVFFRDSTRRLAAELGVTGWVRNLRDGRVEVLAEGEEGAVRRLVDWCRHGPPEADVRDVAVEWREPTGEFDGFTIERARAR